MVLDVPVDEMLTRSASISGKVTSLEVKAALAFDVGEIRLITVPTACNVLPENIDK